MGVSGLWQEVQSICRSGHVSQFRGQRVGVDAYVWLHRAIISCATELGLGQASERFIAFVVSRVEMLQRYGVTPVLVFDGDAMPMKRGTDAKRHQGRDAAREEAVKRWGRGEEEEAARLFSKSIDISPDLAHSVIVVLQEKNIECIVAPFEADAQLAYLSKIGYVQAVISEDSDLIAYNCGTIIAKLSGNGTCDVLAVQDLPRCPAFNTLTYELFLIGCVMSGCDYLPRLPHIGIKTAFRLVASTPCISVLMSTLEVKYGFARSDLNAYESQLKKAFYCFLHHLVFDPISKRIVPLKSLPNDVPLREELVGDRWEDSIAEQVCWKCTLDPTTLQPYKNEYQKSVDLYFKVSKNGQRSLRDFEGFDRMRAARISGTLQSINAAVKNQTDFSVGSNSLTSQTNVRYFPPSLTTTATTNGSFSDATQNESLHISSQIASITATCTTTSDSFSADTASPLTPLDVFPTPLSKNRAVAGFCGRDFSSASVVRSKYFSATAVGTTASASQVTHSSHGLLRRRISNEGKPVLGANRGSADLNVDVFSSPSDSSESDVENADEGMDEKSGGSAANDETGIHTSMDTDSLFGPSNENSCTSNYSGTGNNNDDEGDEKNINSHADFSHCSGVDGDSSGFLRNRGKIVAAFQETNAAAVTAEECSISPLTAGETEAGGDKGKMNRIDTTNFFAAAQFSPRGPNRTKLEIPEMMTSSQRHQQHVQQQHQSNTTATAAPTSNSAAPLGPSSSSSPPPTPCPFGFTECGRMHSIFERCYEGQSWTNTVLEENGKMIKKGNDAYPDASESGFRSSPRELASELISHERLYHDDFLAREHGHSGGCSADTADKSMPGDNITLHPDDSQHFQIERKGKCGPQTEPQNEGSSGSPSSHHHHHHHHDSTSDSSDGGHASNNASSINNSTSYWKRTFRPPRSILRDDGTEGEIDEGDETKGENATIPLCSAKETTSSTSNIATHSQTVHLTPRLSSTSSSSLPTEPSSECWASASTQRAARLLQRFVRTKGRSRSNEGAEHRSCESKNEQEGEEKGVESEDKFSTGRTDTGRNASTEESDPATISCPLSRSVATGVQNAGHGSLRPSSTQSFSSLASALSFSSQKNQATMNSSALLTAGTGLRLGMRRTTTSESLHTATLKNNCLAVQNDSINEDGGDDCQGASSVKEVTEKPHTLPWPKYMRKRRRTSSEEVRDTLDPRPRGRSNGRRKEHDPTGSSVNGHHEENTEKTSGTRSKRPLASSAASSSACSSSSTPNPSKAGAAAATLFSKLAFGKK